MFSLTKGKYTGKIANSLSIDGSIISTTHYSDEESNCDWHNHVNPHISFVFQGGESGSLCRHSNERGIDGVFFYHAGEKHRWISPTPVSKSANIDIGSEQRFFLGWAQVMAAKSTEEFQRQSVANNNHPLSRWRVNGPLSNMPQFAEAFGCKQSQPMIKKDICEIW